MDIFKLCQGRLSKKLGFLQETLEYLENLK